MKNKVSMIAFLMVLAILLCACASGVEPEQTDAVTSSAVPAGIVLFSAEESYKIIRGDTALNEEVQAAVKLRKALSETLTDLEYIMIDSDYVKDNRTNETVDIRGKEILVGETNRRESREILETLDTNEYVIRTVGDKLVILGSSIYATEAAVKQFIEDYMPLATSSSLIIPESIDILGEVSREGPALADGASYRLLSWNLGCSVGVYADVITLLEKYMPEIFALQECNPKMYDNGITPFIRKHREYKYAKQYHASGTRLYTPIIYNADVVDLVHADCEWLKDRYTGTNTKSIGWAVFEMDGQRFAVINFHGAVVSADYDEYKSMTSEQRSDLAKQFRLGNANQIIDLVHRIETEYGKIPITINGDCNFGSGSDPYKVIINAGFTEAEQTADTKIRSGYKTSYSYGKAIPGAGSSIDHIFGINGIHFVSFDIIREEPVVTASDHTPIYADISLDAAAQ